jgi:chromosome segregation ATPase
MAATETVGEGLTFEKVWAALMENREQMKDTDERMKETAERMKETDERMKKTDAQIKETRELVRETSRQIGKLGNRFGETLEYMIVPNLVAKFRELGFEFEKTHRDTKIEDQEHGIFAEIDVFLENGDRTMVVEIKTKPKIEDIDDHVERMEKLRRYADMHKDTRKYLGAMAGVVFNGSEKTYALKKGFYVIEPSGDTFTIIEPAGSYHPHEW